VSHVLALLIAPTPAAIGLQRQGSGLHAFRSFKLRLQKQACVVPTKPVRKTKRLSVFIKGEKRTVGCFSCDQDVLLRKL
jgi:hypothetical protein